MRDSWNDSWEAELAERLARLKAEEADGAQNFAGMYRTAVREAESIRRPVGRPSGRPRLARWAAVATTLAAAALAGILLTAPDADADFEALVVSYSGKFGGAHWQAPTDGLLDVPGMDLISTMPTIGGRFRLPVSAPADPSGNDV